VDRASYFFSGVPDGAPGLIGLDEEPESGELDGGVPPGAPVGGGVLGVPGLVILSPGPDFGAVDLSWSRLQPAAASVSATAVASVRACLIMSGLLL
jgi:hypothetical protein